MSGDNGKLFPQAKKCVLFEAPLENYEKGKGNGLISFNQKEMASFKQKEVWMTVVTRVKIIV